MEWLEAVGIATLRFASLAVTRLGEGLLTGGDTVPHAHEALGYYCLRVPHAHKALCYCVTGWLL